MNVTKKMAREIVFPAMMKLGLDKLIRNLASNSVLNIMYHGVVNEDSNYFSPRNIHRDQFESQIKYLKNNFKILTIPEAFEIQRSNQKLNGKAITVSFDDGLQNNLYTALPVIEKYGIPTTFFISGVCTEEMDTRCLWPEIIESLKYFHANETIDVKSYHFKNLIETGKNIHISDFLKTCDYKERDSILTALIEKYEISKSINKLPEEVWKLMTKTELIQLSASGLVEIGSHGRLHYNLANIDKEKVREELVLSKKLLEKAIGKEVNMVAYPDGSYNSEVKQIAEDAGYKYQLAVNYRTNDDFKDNRILNRHCISSSTTFESNIIQLNLSFLSKVLKTVKYVHNRAH